MPNIPGAFLSGQQVPGIIDGTIVEGATFIAFGQNGQILVYDGDPATGNLIGSWSGMAGSDAESNTYPQGLGLQGSGDLLTVLGSSGAALTLTVIGGIPYLQLPTGAANEANGGAAIQTQIDNPGASEYLTLFVNGPSFTTYPDLASILLESSSANGTKPAGGALDWTDRSGGQHLWLTWGSDGVNVFSPFSGDGITYQTERLTLNMPSNNAVTINTGPYSQSIIGSGNTLGVGTYHVHGRIGVNPGSGGSSTTYAFALGTSGGLVLSGMRVYWQETLVQVGAAFGNAAWVTALAPTGFTTSTIGSGGTDRCITFDGTVIVTTAGTLNLYAATNNTSDTFTVYGYGTYMEITPIGT